MKNDYDTAKLKFFQTLFSSSSVYKILKHYISLSHTHTHRYHTVVIQTYRDYSAFVLNIMLAKDPQVQNLPGQNGKFAEEPRISEYEGHGARFKDNEFLAVLLLSGIYSFNRKNAYLHFEEKVIHLAGKRVINIAQQLLLLFPPFNNIKCRNCR